MGSTPKTSPPAIPILDLRAQYASIREEISAALNRVLDRQQFILGPECEALERELAAYCGVEFGVGVASGTDALALALRACGVREGDEVLVPAFTFVATASAVALVGAKPVFVDIDPASYNISPARIHAGLTDRTRAVIVVHLFGLPAEMDPILSAAQSRGIPLIEDNAQAIGARYRGKRTGSFGNFACLSFYPTKNLGGYGDGGMLLTSDPKAAERIRSLRDHGQTAKYVSSEPGCNSRLDEIQAAVLRAKLVHLDSWNATRQAHARKYTALFSKIEGVIPPAVPEGREHVFHQYTVRIPGNDGNGTSNRDRVQKALAAEGIGCCVYYPVPLHLQPAFRTLSHKAGQFPEAERTAREVLSLPMYPELTEEQIDRVARAVSRALRAT